MKYLTGFTLITIAIIAFIEGTMNMRTSGDTFGAPMFATAILVGVFAFFAGVRMLLAK